MHGDIAYWSRVLVIFPYHPSRWISGAHKVRAKNMGEIELGAIVAEKSPSRPKSVYSKNHISHSQERWTLAFCMNATGSLQSLYQQWFRFEAQEKHSQHFDRWRRRKLGKMAEMPILRHIYPWDTKG